MSPVTHALVGAVLGKFLDRPGVTFLTGATSHTLLDYLPHNDSQHPLVLFGNGCGVFAVLAAACVTRDKGMLAGALGGVLPDLEHIREGTPPAGTTIFPGHHFLHEGRYSAALGIGVEVVLAATSLLALFLAGTSDRRRMARDPA